MPIQNDHLPFWYFFQRIEKELGYKRWIFKYKLFLEQLNGPYLRYDEEAEHFLSFCKILYLQDQKDEIRFTRIFKDCWATEKAKLAEYFEQYVHRKDTPSSPIQSDGVKPTPDEKRNDPTNHTKSAAEKSSSTGVKEQTIGEKKPEEKEFFIELPLLENIKQIDDAASPAAQDKRYFNFQDEYLPVSRREMAKAWQYMRHHEKGDKTTALNIPETVKRVARDMLFTEPAYYFGKKNRKDTIILFVDQNGSMAPFHELSRRMVVAAKKHGGHQDVQAFYFQNYPVGYVYNKSNLTEPRKTVEALSKMNNNYTIAIIISDAGFAKSYGSEERFNTRMEFVTPFFKLLQARCAHTVWLNPMPDNRWHKPTFDKIAANGVAMVPITGEGLNPFQTMLKSVLKKSLKTG